MYKTAILPAAKKDIREAAQWYNRQKHGLGKRFTSEIRKTIRLIQQNPKSINVRYNSTRTAVVKIFPFMDHFTVDDENKIVIISAVLHTSRNPNLWKNRNH